MPVLPPLLIRVICLHRPQVYAALVVPLVAFGLPLLGLRRAPKPRVRLAGARNARASVLRIACGSTQLPCPPRWQAGWSVHVLLPSYSVSACWPTYLPGLAGSAGGRERTRLHPFQCPQEEAGEGLPRRPLAGCSTDVFTSPTG